MRGAAAIWVLIMLLANALVVSGCGGADNTLSGAHRRDASRAVTLIYDVYDLQNMSLDLKGSYELANDIDASATAGWNSGAGFAPVGDQTYSFNGTLDGKGFNITGLFIDYPPTDYVGLFGRIDIGGLVKNIGLVDDNVTGGSLARIGGLVGENDGSVNNSYATGSVIGDNPVGGLIGYNLYGTVDNSYATGDVTGSYVVGGLVGEVYGGTVRNSHATGNVSGTGEVGGLAGYCSWDSTVSDSYACGNVTASMYAGGLVGYACGMLNNSHYDIDKTLINGEHIITVGGIFDTQYQDWFSNSLSLKLSDYGASLVPAGEYFKINNVQGLRDLLGFADVGGYKFLLGADIDLSGDPGFYIPYFAGEFDGDNNTISNLSVNRTSTFIAMFGYNNGGTIENVRLENNNVNGYGMDGGLVGYNNGGIVIDSSATGNVTGYGTTGGLVGYNEDGIISDSHAAGNVTGEMCVGGLVGENLATIINSSAAENVTGTWSVGGLVGGNSWNSMMCNSYACGNITANGYIGGLVGDICGPVNNSHYDINNMLINGEHIITVGALFDTQYQDWFSRSLSLKISDYSTNLVPAGEYFKINNVQGLRDLLGFADVGEYKFLLGADIDLSGDPGFYIPYFAGEFDGDNHTISNLSVNISFLTNIAMFGYNNGGTIRNVRLENNNVNGYCDVGGLVGENWYGMVTDSSATGTVTGNSGWGSGDFGGLVGFNTGTVSKSYFMGNVTGGGGLGGLVGENYYNSTVSESFATGNVIGTDGMGGLVGLASGTVINSYATGNVAGTGDYVGGLVGCAYCGTVNNSYATGNVVGIGNDVGGLVGNNTESMVSNCFWDTETSGQNVSCGGTGKTTTEMKTCSTFTDAGWDFDNVWFMEENVTYPLLTALRPTANAGPDMAVDAGTLVTFDGSASFDRSGIVNYAWTFTDELPVAINGIRPTHCFLNPGIFPVTLKITNIIGYWATDAVTVTVINKTLPIADAGPDQTIHEGTSVMFDGSGSRDSIGIVNYTWTFIDGTEVTLFGIRPTYLFDHPGVFVVTLNVTDAAGSWATDTMTVTVIDTMPPVADAGPDQTIDEGTPVTFDGSASKDNAGIVNYSWKFIDGTPVTLYGVRPAYRFDHPGIFVVTLTVTDAAGNRGTDTMTVTVRDITRPVADAGPDQVTNEGTIVYFDGTGSNDNVGVVNYTWTFADGAPVTLYGARPTYMFDNPGIFTVSLNVRDAAGNWNIDTMTVTVKDITAPIADAGPNQTVDHGTVVAFNGNGSSDNVGVVNFTWTFTDGGPVTLYGARPTYKFDNPGIFLVKLKVTDAAGNWGIDTLTVTVQDVSVPPICTITFPIDTSTVSGTINITGLAIAGRLPLERVEVRIDGGDWKQATGLETWKLVLDTRTLTNGRHTIEARAFGGQLTSDNAMVTIIVNNAPSQVIPPSSYTITIDQFPWLLLQLILIAVGVMVALYFGSRRGFLE